MLPHSSTSIGLCRRPRASVAAFSLVEVALAVGLLATAFIPLFALMPSGITGFRRAIDLTVCTQIAQRVVNDARQLDFDLLVDRATLRNRPDAQVEGFTFRAPSISDPQLRYFDDEGGEVVPVTPGELSAQERQLVVYQVNTRVMPQAPIPLSAKAAESLSKVRRDPDLALITVEVAFAPTAVPMSFSDADPGDRSAPKRNLFVPRSGRDIYTFSASVGRAL